MPFRPAIALLALAVSGAVPAGAQQAATKTAIFAGGCFWCVESDFDHLKGVVSTESGYTGGTLDNPTYADVVSETTGHYESVQVTFDPAQVSYDTLLDVYFHAIDPTDADGQFCDRGPSYRTAVFTTDADQMKAAEAAKAKVAAELGKPVATLIAGAKTFYPAEDYHQDYYLKNPVKYQYYRLGCGRNDRVRQVWGDKAYRGIGEAGS